MRAPRPVVACNRAAQAHVLGDDAGVPGAARGGHPAGDQVGEDGREVEHPEALQRAEPVELRAASRRSAGMAEAPATTLKRMYHCVPSSISTMLPQPSPTPGAASAATTAGKSIGAGKEAATCTTGCSTRESRGESPMASPAGSAQSVPSAVAASTRREGEERRAADARPGRRRHRAEQADQARRAEREQREQRGEEAVRTATWQRAPAAPARGARRRDEATPRRGHCARHRGRRARESHGSDARAAQQIEEPGRHRLGLAALLHPELLRPDHDRTPEELIERDDHQRSWRATAAAMARRVAARHRDAHVRAEAGQAEVLIAEDERLAHHQEEPAARHAHHAVPDEPDRARRGAPPSGSAATS